MALFRKKKPSLGTRPVEGHDDLIAVHETNLQPFVEEVFTTTAANYNELSLDEDIEEKLQLAHGFVAQERDLPEADRSTAYSAARFGYFARGAEFDGNPEARNVCMSLYASCSQIIQDWSKPAGGEMDDVDVGLALLVVSASLAAEMILSPPPPPDATTAWSRRASSDTLAWALPGLGPPFRRLLMAQSLAAVLDGVGIDAANLSHTTIDLLKRTWMTGYILRCTHEYFDNNLLADEALRLLDEFGT